MYRYKWNSLEEPKKLSSQKLVEKYNFYKFVRFWSKSVDNTLLDKICDLSDEIERRNLKVIS